MGWERTCTIQKKVMHDAPHKNPEPSVSSLLRWRRICRCFPVDCIGDVREFLAFLFPSTPRLFLQAHKKMRNKKNTLITLQSGPEKPLLHWQRFGPTQVPADGFVIFWCVGCNQRSMTHTMPTTFIGSQASTHRCSTVLRRPALITHAFHLLLLWFHHEPTRSKGSLMLMLCHQWWWRYRGQIIPLTEFEKYTDDVPLWTRSIPYHAHSWRCIRARTNSRHTGSSCCYFFILTAQ